MAVTDLDTFKKHVRSDDYSDDDAYLQSLLTAAESWVLRATNRTEAELTEMGDGVFPPELLVAIYQLGAHWYNQREAVSGVQMHEVPYTLQAIIKPFRKLTDDEEG